MKKICPLTLLLLVSIFIHGQNLNWDGSGVGTKTSDYNTSVQVAQIGWGSHHGILFNAYRSPTLVDGFLNDVGNTKHSFDAGPYNSGAGAIMYIGNGGRMDFLVSDNSTGAGNNVVWGTPKMSIGRNGNIGIGTASPGSKVDIAVNGLTGVNISGNSSSYIGAEINITRSSSGIGVGTGAALQLNDLGSSSYNIIQGSSGGLQFFNWYNNSGWIERMRIDANGNIGIGNPNPDAKLTVTGQVHAQEVKVTVNAPGPDYVFEKDYPLTSLEEIKNYIDQNKHLPEVPSAKEMEKDGVQLGEMNMLLLKKIEELTLYVIEQSEKIELQSELIKHQNDRIAKLEK